MHSRKLCSGEILSHFVKIRWQTFNSLEVKALTSRRNRAFPSRVSLGGGGSRPSRCGASAAHRRCRSIEALPAQRLMWPSTISSAAPPPVCPVHRVHVSVSTAITAHAEKGEATCALRATDLRPATSSKSEQEWQESNNRSVTAV